MRRRQASYIPIVLSKAALSGPSVCLRARAPCPLRVSCLRIARERSSRVPAGARQWTVPSSRSGAPVPHPPGPRGRAARAAGLRSSGWLLGTRQFINAGARLLCTSDGVCVIVYVQFSSVGAGMVWGGGSSLHSGIEFGRSRTGKGSSGGRKKGVV